MRVIGLARGRVGGLAVTLPRMQPCCKPYPVPHEWCAIPQLAASPLCEPLRPGPTTVEHAGRGLLHRGAGGGPGVLRHAGDLQHRPQGSQLTSFAFTARLREAGIRISMDGRGWVDGQDVHRAAVALAQMRGGLPARNR